MSATFSARSSCWLRCGSVVSGKRLEMQGGNASHQCCQSLMATVVSALGAPDYRAGAKRYCAARPLMMVLPNISRPLIR
jgi:hypothetical protein